jgi:nucleotide-binding universal stress UspA family protein
VLKGGLEDVVMAFPYQKILCPIDFDENSLQALDKAAEIARQFKSEMIIVHVVPIVLETPDLSHSLERYEEQEKAARARLGEITAKRLDGIRYEAAIYVGDIVGCILREVEKFEPDVLVMATHGRGGFARFHLGSVAEAVVRKSSCPVLTIGNESRSASA